MNSATFAIDSSARRRDADIWFALPAGFLPLPFKEVLDARNVLEGADGGEHPLLQLVGELDASERRQERGALFAPVLRAFDVLACSGVLHCSMGLHLDDEGNGGVLPSLFTLSWRQIAWAPRNVIAARLAAGLHEALHVEVLELPCGPACLAVTRLSPPDVGVAGQLFQIAVHVPYPDATKLAVLTLATTAAHRVDDYRDLLRATARIVTFESPLPVERGEV
ncbi:MAG: hypothetical protein HOQ07_07975 [Sinomonas sp.]|nr:hypothetical protein [Sinomonas sp.]